MVSAHIRKWLGVLRLLRSGALYGKGILQLPASSLTEEFKSTKVRIELLLSGSKDVIVREVDPYPTKRRKWNLSSSSGGRGSY